MFLWLCFPEDDRIPALVFAIDGRGQRAVAGLGGAFLCVQIHLEDNNRVEDEYSVTAVGILRDQWSMFTHLAEVIAGKFRGARRHPMGKPSW